MIRIPTFSTPIVNGDIAMKIALIHYLKEKYFKKLRIIIII